MQCECSKGDPGENQPGWSQPQLRRRLKRIEKGKTKIQFLKKEWKKEMSSWGRGTGAQTGEMCSKGRLYSEEREHDESSPGRGKRDAGTGLAADGTDILLHRLRFEIKIREAKESLGLLPFRRCCRAPK
jgi:hypothetical protein